VEDNMMMIRMLTESFVAASLLTMQCLPFPAYAENQMGYRLLSPQEASALPHNHGALGLAVERAQQITDGGMTFDIIRVTQVRQASTGAQAGFNVGDEIIAVDGCVFSSLASFAAYIGSSSPGRQITVDYIPAGGGPQQALRVAVVVGSADPAQAPTSTDQGDGATSTGMSTGTKVAIGVGAVALLGCYEKGCFSHHHASPAPSNAGRQQFQQQRNGVQSK
jgi:predicted metalloprotease with PDZ domain